MHVLLDAILDIIFPPSKDAQLVRDTTLETLQRQCSPCTVGDRIAITSYRMPIIQAFVREAKFRRNQRAIVFLGHILGEYLNKSLPQNQNEDMYLVPIPLSAERVRERGYNQTLLIVLATQTFAPRIRIEENLLLKIHHTPSQTSLSRTQRLKNLEGAFAVGAHTLPLHTHIILFDDITTTGTTLAEAAKTLAHAGFTNIEQLALAH